MQVIASSNIPPRTTRDGIYIHHTSQPQVIRDQSILPKPSIHALHQQSSSVKTGVTETLSNALKSSVVPQRENTDGYLPPNGTTYISTEAAGCADVSSNSSVASTFNGTYRNSSSAVLVPLPSSSEKESEQSIDVGNAISLSAANTLTTSKPQEHNTRAMSTSPSVESGSPLNSEDKELHPASLGAPSQLESDEQESDLENDSGVSSKRDTVDVTVSPEMGVISQSPPAQPAEEVKLSDYSTTTSSSATDTATGEEDERAETCTATPNDDSISGSSPEDDHKAEPETPGSQPDRGDEASLLETNDASPSLKPVLTVEESSVGIVLSWDLLSREEESKVIKYELFVMSAPTEETPSNSWDLLGVVDALALPMACTMNQFQPGASYFFTVRAVTENYDSGMFSEPCSVTVNGPAN